MISVLLLVLMAGLLVYAHRQGIKANHYNKVAGGVCSGIAQRYGMTPPLVRALYVIFTICTGGFAILLYIFLWATLPTE